MIGMMRRRERLLALAAGGRALAAPTRERRAARTLAVTVDDLPAARRSFPTPILDDFDAFRAKNKQFLAQAVERSVQLSGFVNEGWTPRAWPQGALAGILEDWLDAGADLGNHTYSHLDLYGSTEQRYLAEVVLGEATLGSVLAGRGRRIRYFRPPYLHSRKDGEDSAQIEDYLQRAGYRTAPVTVDTQDWIFAEVYAWALARGDKPRRNAAAEAYLQRAGYRTAPVTVDTQDWIFAEVYAWALARGDKPRRNGAAEAYLAYFDALLDHVERTSRATLGREPAQVLLLHVNALNFDLIGDLLDLMAKRSYQFVSLDEALEDPAYLDDGPASGSWIHGWSRARGLQTSEDPKPDRFLGMLLEDYQIVKSTMPGKAAPLTKRVCDI